MNYFCGIKGIALKDTLPPASFIFTKPSTCDQGGFALTGVMQAGFEPFTYQWNNGSTAAFINDVSPGNFSVTVTDSLAQQNTHSTEVEGILPLRLNPALTQISELGAADAQIELTPENGVSPYTIEWSTGDTTALITDLPAGYYSATLTDAEDCTNTETLAIFIEPTIELEILNGIDCHNEATGIIAVHITGGIEIEEFTWSHTDSQADTLYNVAPGEYSINIKVAPGFDLSASVSLPDLPDSEAMLLNSQLTQISAAGATDGSLSVTPTNGAAPYSVLWNTGTTETQINNLSAGFYSVTVTDAEGCTKSEEFAVFVPPTLELEVINGIDCYDEPTGALAVHITGGIEVESVSLPFTPSPSDTVYNLHPSYYSVTVYVSPGFMLTASVSLPNAPQLTSTAEREYPTAENTPNGFISVTPDGGAPPYSIAWQDGNTDFERENLLPGIYSYVITDAKGCTADREINLWFQPYISYINIVQPSCPGAQDGSAQVGILGGSGSAASFYWDNGATGNTLENLGAGTYTGTVFISNNVLHPVVEIIDPAPLDIHPLFTFVSANEKHLSLDITGGTAPFEIEWLNGITTDTLYFVEPGDYPVLITDANGCQDSTVINVVISSVQNPTFSEIKIAPNPTHMEVVIFNDLTESSAYNLRVFNLQGTQILERKSILNAEYRVDLSPFAAGLYLFEIEQDGEAEFRRVFKVE